jgi:ABC-type transport system involved in multi-copper enzyme maturation, permease component
MSNNIVVDVTKKSAIVAKNEFTKYLRGKKLILCAGIMVLILGMISILPYVFGDGLPKESWELTYLFVFFADLIVILTATLFGSTTIVSEYEERTALITFTKPIRKISIFLGKFVAAAVVGILFTLIYYAATMAICYAVTGEIASATFNSMGLALLYVFATMGVAMLISSAMKKSSSATIMTFITLLLLMTVLSYALSSSVETWWMLDQAKEMIMDVVEGTETMSIMTAVGVMIAWGTVTSVLSYVLFKRRDF